MIANENSALRMFEALAERRARKRPPSQRDRDIAAAVRVQGRRQVEVAAEFGLTRRRVSQICRNIEDWHGSTAPWERNEPEGPRLHQIERVLQRDQLTEIYQAALRAYARSEQPLVTRRSGKRGEQRWSDRSQRQQRRDTGSLRVALKAIEMQWQLADRPFNEDEGKDEATRLRGYLLATAGMLEFVRKDAERRGAVPKVPGGPKAAVERMLREFLGVPEGGTPEEGATGVPPVSGESSGSEAAAGEDSSTASDRSRRPDDNAGLEAQPSSANPHWPDASATHRHWPEPRATPASNNSSMGSVWEAPPEAPWETPASAASDEAEASYAVAAAAGSGLGSASKIEQGNASQTANAVRSYAEKERLALAELQRVFATEITSALADHMVPNLLAEGQSNLLLQGYTRRDRQALLGWQRVMDLRKREAHYAAGVTEHSPGSRAERAHPGMRATTTDEP